MPVRGVLITFLFPLLAVTAAWARESAGEQSVVVVMIDGVRWQEVFRGADPDIAANEKYMDSPWAADVRAQFLNVADRSKALMPFLNGVIASNGALIGNRDQGSCAEVANDYWFSYPGYSEALTGVADPRINSNDFGPNPNVTFLEWLNSKPAFAGKVRVVASWDAIDRIVNSGRSKIPTNVAEMPSGRSSPTMTLLDRLISNTPNPWKSNRFDSFTHEIALEALRTDKPRVLFIQYAQPDDFGHEGDYPQYLLSIYRADRFLQELWASLQSDRQYTGRTTLLVSPDHGRGSKPDDSWRGHASAKAMKTAALRERNPNGIVGSNEIWIGAIGLHIHPATRSAQSRGCAHLSQVAATALLALGEPWRNFNPQAAPPLNIFERAP